MNIAPKKIIRDIIPKKDLVSLPTEKSMEEKNIFSAKTKSSVKKIEAEIQAVKKTKNKSSYKPLKWVIIAVPIFLTFSAVIYLLMPAGAAIIKIVPESKNIEANVFIKLSDNDGDIKLSVLKLTQEKEGKIQGSGNEFVEKKASGTIIIYNAFGPNPQTLIANTRFETPDGKIYRLEKTVTIPGSKKQNGQIVAGSIEAVIFADKTGKEYNLEFSDFNLPGLKGTPKYQKIYARSKNPINGGFKGNMPKINENDLNNLRQKTDEELKAVILNKLDEAIPENSIFIKESGEFKYSYDNLTSNGTGDNFDIKEKAEFNGILIDKNELANFLAKKYLKNNDFEKNTYIKDLNNLKFTILKKDLEAKEAIIKAEGKTKIVKIIDEQKLKNELASAKNKNAVFISHPEIIKADIKLKPLFKIFFPNDASKIKIDIEI